MAKNSNSKYPKKFDDEWDDKWGEDKWIKQRPVDKGADIKSAVPKSADSMSEGEGLAQSLEGEALLKETCRRLRAAKSLWDAHRNPACRREREKALALYNQLTKAQKEKVPQQLRIWLRYRSEKYFGDHQTKPGHKKRSAKGQQSKAKQTKAQHQSQKKSKGKK